MYRHSVQDQKLKRELYKICFEDVTLQNTLFNKRTKWFEGIFLLSLAACIILLMVSGVLMAFWNADLSPMYGITMVSLLVISLCFMLATISSSRIHIKSQYKDLAFMIGKNKFKLDREVLFSIRCDQVYYYLKNNDYDYNALDDLIAYYSIEGESIKKNGWVPFAIFTAFIFPFWNETVSKYLNWTEIDQIVPLVLFAILLPMGIWVWRQNVELFIFSKPNNYLELARILRTAKTFPKF